LFISIIFPFVPLEDPALDPGIKKPCRPRGIGLQGWLLFFVIYLTVMTVM
jgi:hypothetical protein